MKKKEFKFYFLWLSLIIFITFFFQIFFSGFTEAFLLNDNVYDGEVWRYITSIFLHGGTSHLIYNLFALLLFGFILENLIGSKRFLAVFFGSGIIANIISVNFYPASLGASGAIYGIIGCITILKPFMIVWAFGLIMPIFLAAILWILGDILGIFMPSNVGNIAHLSGVLIGFLTGFLLRKKRKKKRKVKIPESYLYDWENKWMK